MSRLRVHAILWAFIAFFNLMKTTELLIIKTSDLNNNANKEYSPNDEPVINYDEYPMIVPKRAAMLLDRIMVALHHALEDDEKGSKKINDVYKDGRYFNGKKDYMKSDKNYNRFIPNGYEQQDIVENPPHLDTSSDTVDQPKSDDMMGLQRRRDTAEPNKGGRVYWRCYFNAVTCF